MINEYKVNRLIIFLFFFAPFISLLIYNIIKIKFIVLLPQFIREFLVTFMVLIFFFHRSFWIRYKILGLLILLMFLYIAIQFFIYFPIYLNINCEQFLKSIINNIRRFVFVFVLLIYFLFILKRQNYYLYISLMFKYLYIFWIFGLISYFFPLDFWYTLNLNAYWADIVNQVAGNGATFIIPFEQTGKMFTNDTYYILGFKAKRLISFYLEPTTTASLAIASLFLSYLYKKKFLFYLTLISGFLTFSKAFYIFSVLLFFYNIMIKLNKKLILLYNIFVSLVLIIPLIMFYIVYIHYPYLFKFGFFAHLEGLYNYFNNFNPLGYGIGLSGSFSIVDNPLKIGIESSFANIVSQLGIVGMIIILFYFLWLKNKLNNKYIFILIFFYFFLYITSNSATGYSGNFLIIFIFAYLIKQRYYNYVNHNYIMIKKV